MQSEITGTTPLALLTVSQFVELLNERKTPGQSPASQPADSAVKVVHGLRGIRNLFGVSHSTAQSYKNSFLKPAVSQRGRVIVTDVAHALRLFDEYRK